MAYFSAAEAKDVAVEVGELGQAYYRLIAEKTGYPRVRALLMEMAQEEAGHCAAWTAAGNGHGGPPVRSEEEWQEYQEYVSAVARGILPYAPEQLLATVEQARGERDVIGLARELTESLARFVATLCRTASLDGCQDIAERALGDKESRLEDLDRMLWSMAPEQGRARHSQVAMGVPLPVEERELSSLTPVTAGS